MDCARRGCRGRRRRRPVPHPTADRAGIADLDQRRRRRIRESALMRLRFNWIIGGLIAIPAAPGFAQSGGFGSPTAGYIYSPAGRSVRPLMGIRGSSYIGSPVLSDIDSASIAPDGKWVFVTREGRP